MTQINGDNRVEAPVPLPQSLALPLNAERKQELKDRILQRLQEKCTYDSTIEWIDMVV